MEHQHNLKTFECWVLGLFTPCWVRPLTLHKWCWENFSVVSEISFGHSLHSSLYNKHYIGHNERVSEWLWTQLQSNWRGSEKDKDWVCAWKPSHEAWMATGLRSQHGLIKFTFFYHCSSWDKVLSAALSFHAFLWPLQNISLSMHYGSCGKQQHLRLKSHFDTWN